MITWIEKYRPNYFSEIIGQDQAAARLKDFVSNFSNSRRNAMILHGGPGTGKTTLAMVAAKESNSEIFELNASDLRNKGKLQEVLKPAIEQRSLIKKGKIILVDEVDGISAVDRGGLTELINLINTTTIPIVITANDIWKQKLSPLRKKCELIELKDIEYSLLKAVMIDILRKENKFIANEILTKIAINAKGDLRAAINDLQTAANMPDPSKLFLDERNKKTDIFNALKLIFKGKPTNETLRIFDSVDIPIDELFLWMEENIPKEYKDEDLAKAYHAISNADLFKGRIYRKQYWRFLVYENIFLSYGISASKEKSNTAFTTYNKPTRVLKIWLNNQRSAKKKSISQKYAKLVHVGQKRAMREFPIIKQILKNHLIRRELRLSDEEIEYLDKPMV